MSIELSKEARKEAISSIERYFAENMEEKIGNVAAGGLLGYFLEEIGPLVDSRGQQRRSAAHNRTRTTSSMAQFIGRQGR